MQVFPTPHPEPGDTMPYGDVESELCQTPIDLNLDVSEYSEDEQLFWFRYGKGRLSSTATTNIGTYKFGDIKAWSPLQPKGYLRNARIEDVFCWLEPREWAPDIHWIEYSEGSVIADGIFVVSTNPYETSSLHTKTTTTTYETYCLFLNEWSHNGTLISSEEILGSCWTVEVT